MNFNKRKILDDESDGDDDRHCQSSLQVNLSNTNLSDSGHGSLRRTELENDSALPKTANHVRRSSRLRSSKSQLNAKTTHNISDKNMVQLKNVSAKEVKIVLEDINKADKSLTKSCNRLKNIILNKTKEIFNHQDELVTKTATTLGHEALVCKSVNESKKNNVPIIVSNIILHGNVISKNLTDNATKISKEITDKNKIPSLFNDRNKANSDQCNVSHMMINKKQLFTCNQYDKHDPENNDKNLTNTLPNTMHSANGNESPILSGSHKTNSAQNLKQLSLCMPTRNIGGNKNMQLYLSHQVVNNQSTTSILEDEIPIANSTMIEHNLNLETKQSLVSMEMTDMRGGFLIESPNCAKPNSSNNLDSKFSRSTNRTSLCVNTSIDLINQVDDIQTNNNNVQQSDLIDNKSCAKTQDNNRKCSNIESPNETINTVCTSLQVNTSLHKNQDYSPQCKEKIDNSDESNRNVANNIIRQDSFNLIKRFTNMNIPASPKCHQKSTNPTTISINESENEENYIEATPYPPTRSSLLRPQLKNRMHLQDLEKKKNLQIIEANINSIGSTILNLDSVTMKKANHPTTATIILEESSVSKIQLSSSETVFIPDSSREDNLQQNNSSKTFSKLKPRRRKLFQDNSQLVSFSPIEDIPQSPKHSTIFKRQKKTQKKICNLKAMLNNDTVISQSEEDVNNLTEDSDFAQKQKKRKPRKALRKKMVIKKLPNKTIVNMVKEKDMEKGITSIPSSTDQDFQNHGLHNLPKQRNAMQRITIVATGLSKEDKNLVRAIAKSLGNAKIELNVSRQTTHVITTGVRTINLLHGIIRGCWLVRLDWALKSLENGGWLAPEKFEMAHFSKAVMENRRDRQLFGKCYVPELFATCGLIYVETGSCPPANVLKDLIKVAGGRITENPQTAKIIIGAESLKESWILDCITTGELQSLNAYQRH